MTGPMLARDWLLLGAESLLASPKDELPDVHAGFPVKRAEWAQLGEQLRAHVAAIDGDPSQLRLRSELGLGERSYWLVMLVAATELYPEAAAAASLLAEDERLHLLTPLTSARLLRAGLDIDFDEALREALPTGTVRRLGLLDVLEVLPGRPSTHHGLRLRAEELAALLDGGRELATARAVQVVRVAPAERPAFSEHFALGAAKLLAARGLLGLRCESPRAGRQFALDIATVRGQNALFVAIDALPDLSDVGRLRDGSTVVLDFSGWPNERPFPVGFVAAAAALLPALVVIVSRQATTGTFTALPVPALGRDEGRRIWTEAIENPDDAVWLSTRFRMGLEEVRLARAEAVDRAEVERDPHPLSRENVARAVLAQGSRRMGRSVTHLMSSVALSDLVVPPALERKIRDIIAWHATSARVESEYGLPKGVARSAGLACLFSGQPGTGKTFAAQCIANELGLNLYRIDLSQVVSKYIGETEKALAQVFDEAEAGHGVLLFDEADALFGKRTEVKDAHDRYANVEVGYLLQRVESFSGIAILTTNLRDNIDSAFARRLRFVLDFPVPDRDRRQELWERSLPPPHLRSKDLDLSPFIDRFRLSGGYIHNIGLAATHLAAATADGLLGQAQLVQATFRELEKAGLARSAAEFGPLAAWLPGKEA